MRRKDNSINQQIFVDLINNTSTEEGRSITRRDLAREYEKILKKYNRPKAFIVRFDGLKDLTYISLQNGETEECRYKAEYEATKYFTDNFHPVFLSENMLYKARGIREHKLDKYVKEGGIPIINLMEEISMTFPCKACGTGKFDYEDYEMKRCFVTEELDQYPYTKGVILCKDCFNKYMGR